MNMKRTLAISIVCGVAAFILAAAYLHLKEREVSGGAELKDVLVAAVGIREHALMEPGLVVVKRVPRIFIQPGAVTDVREILGKVSIAKIEEGEQILGTKLVAGGPESGLSFKIPERKRAVGIEISSESSAGGLIRPDDYVDIVVTFDYGDSGGADKYTYTLFQNVPVLAVNADTTSIRNQEGIAVVEKKSNQMFGAAPEMRDSKSGTSIVTLALDPEDVQKLIFAKEAGMISLSLRSPMDTAFYENLLPVKLESMTGRAGLVRKDYREYRGK